eukprot:TRINITY_DN537_c0_g1_i1.p1 TRINITY_DN537_c0_g1~~TRINITY_DN537_c0_g1_i1.p1  ORF type:complete len:531 (+),score=143.68 TRINITY_DN537_c0_g1_i1:187-1779(+)
MAKVSVKVQYKEDIRRVSFEEKPSFNALFQLIKNLFADAQVEQFSIRYVDDESDLISITNDREISEAWEFARVNKNLLKLKIASDPTAKAPEAQPVQPKVENVTVSSTTTTSTPTRPVPRPTTTQSPPARPVTDVTAEMMSNFIESIISEIRKIRDVTAPEIQALLATLNIEDMMKQFQPVIQPVLQQFTSEGYPAQLYANRAHITANVENDFYKHMNPILNAFRVPDFHPKINLRPKTTTSTTTSSTVTPSPCTTSNPVPTAAPEPLVPTPSTEEGTASPPYTNVFCNLCNKSISGNRYKCTDCRQYDLCGECHPLAKIIHNNQHTFTNMVYNSTNNSAPSSSTPAAAPVAQAPAMSSRLVKDVTIEDGTQVEVRSQFKKTWRMKNNGNVAWGKGTRLVFVQGDLPCGEVESVEVPEVEAGGEIDVSIDMIAPSRPGRYISNFRLEDGTGMKFGHRIWVDIVVIEAEVKKEEKVEEKKVEKVEEKVVKKDENEEKLELLESMGFCDRERNMRLLAKYRGDIVLAINEYM